MGISLRVESQDDSGSDLDGDTFNLGEKTSGSNPVLPTPIWRFN